MAEVDVPQVIPAQSNQRACQGGSGSAALRRWLRRIRPIWVKTLRARRMRNDAPKWGMVSHAPTDALPLFPLNVVLYPQMRLSLKIFEPRYLDMVRACARNDSGFGVCLILEGSEVGEPASPAAVGTLARIVDFGSGDDGLLSLVVQGERRFRVRRTRVQTDGLLRGEVSWLPQEPACEVPVEFALLQTILERLHERMPADGVDVSRQRFDDAVWVGFRLAELLPLTNEEHQRLLELTDPLQRLQELQLILPRFQKG